VKTQLPDHRTPKNELENYIEFLEDSRMSLVISSRCDKISLLWLARIAAVAGHPDQADRLYAEYCATFPCSARDAVSERRQLGAGDLKSIKDALTDSAKGYGQRIYPSFSIEDVRLILIESESHRIEAAIERLKQK